MRSFLLPFVAICLLPGLADRIRAADDDLRAVVDKAIKAHGGEARLTKFKAGTSKTKGTLYVQGNKLPFTQEASVQFPNQVKSVLEIEAGGQKITITTVFNGKKGWLNIGGNTTDMDDKLLDLVKNEMYVAEVMRLTGLKDKTYELSPLGEAKVDGKAAIGIRVASKGRPDVNIYFDKASGLMAKVEHRSMDPMSGKEFTEEKLLSDYHDADGLKSPKRVVINHDGDKFMDAEEVESKHVESLDESVFAKP
jgi:hypothetical protein